MAAAIRGHLLPQCHDLFRPEDARTGSAETFRLPGTGRLPFCGTCGKSLESRPHIGICTAGDLPKIRETGQPVDEIVVGIADCRVGDVPGQILATYALGSCIGLSVYDPTVVVGGLLHFMLPDSTIDSARGRENP